MMTVGRVWGVGILYMWLIEVGAGVRIKQSTVRD